MIGQYTKRMADSMTLVRLAEKIATDARNDLNVFCRDGVKTLLERGYDGLPIDLQGVDNVAYKIEKRKVTLCRLWGTSPENHIEITPDEVPFERYGEEFVLAAAHSIDYALSKTASQTCEVS